jgi:hypothetical protein
MLGFLFDWTPLQDQTYLKQLPIKMKNKLQNFFFNSSIFVSSISIVCTESQIQHFPSTNNFKMLIPHIRCKEIKHLKS